MRSIILTAALLASASVATAQMPVKPIVELRPMAGVFIPTGPQADAFKTAVMYGAQAAVEVHPTLHLLGTFAWSPGHSKFAVLDRAVNVYQYDLGAEFNLLKPLGAGWDLKPFLGLGAGARTYDYAASNLSTWTQAAGYAAAGTEFQYGVTALRIEARDYLYGFKDPVTDLSRTRNEVALSIGVAFHLARR